MTGLFSSKYFAVHPSSVTLLLNVLRSSIVIFKDLTNKQQQWIYSIISYTPNTKTINTVVINKCSHNPKSLLMDGCFIYTYN